MAKSYGAASPTDWEAGWNSADLDMLRFHVILKTADEMGIRLRMRDNRVIEPYFALLSQFWISIRPMVLPAVQEKIDEKLQEIRNKVDRWVIVNEICEQPLFDRNIGNMLSLLHEDLLAIRQVLNLGVPIRRKYDNSQAARLRSMMKNG